MRIGEALKEAGLISEHELETALSEQKKTHDRLGDILLKMGFVTPEEIIPALADYFHIPFVILKKIYKEIPAEVVDSIPLELARRFTVIPIEKSDKILTVAMLDPLDILVIDTLRIKTGFKVQCAMAIEHDIIEAIEYCYYHLPRMKEHIQEFVELEVRGEKVHDEEMDALRFGADDQPVVQYVKSLIVQAINSRASDILLQPKEDISELRLRIDGVLYHIDPPPKAMLAAITTRLKIISGLDIAERRLPQDGRFKVQIGETEVDIRISSYPTIYGESIVMRLLNTSSPLLGLEQLGMYAEDLDKFRKLLKHSYGLILVTGPTGSGKTTTLYTSLNELKSKEKNIITIEDPVEYRLPFIQQSQINAQIGFDFARGLRSILRQDPDIIMVGEIRDKETAEIAIHAALTGHLVFSTLHTNDASGAPVRLINMGVEPFLITSTLLGVVAQRLIRTICPDCRKPYKVENDVQNQFCLDSKTTRTFHGEGCPKCLNSGYRGRMGIYEVLIPDETVRKLILQRKSSEEIRSSAQKSGMKTLRQIGIEKLKQGLTSLEEVLRVTQETEEY